MYFPDRETVERVRKQHPAGCRIVLDHMDDPYTKIPLGTQGTVKGVDDSGSIMPCWDSGSGLHVVYGEDRCHKIHTETEARTTINWYGRHQKAKDGRCPRCGEVMPGPRTRHAISRWADITVCDSCGTIEALEQAGLAEKLPLMKWRCIEEPQNGGGEWNG